MNVGLEMDLH